MSKIQSVDLELSASPKPSAALADDASWRALLAPGLRAPLAMVSLGIGLHAFNAFLAATALPFAVSELGGAQWLPWSSTLYLTGSIVAGASTAGFKARFGMRLALVLATLVFLLGSATAGLAGTMGGVIFGRLLQGLSEGAVLALCYMLISAFFPQRLMARVFGIEAAVWAVSAFGGPVLAGLLTEAISWRAAFLVNIPAGLAFLALAILALRSGQENGDLMAGADSVPAGRLTLLILGLVLLLAANLTALDITRHTMIGVAIGAFLLFVAVDRQSLRPILPGGAFSCASRVGLGLWLVLLMPLSQAASGVYLVYALKHVWDMGPLTASAVGALTAVSWSLVAVTSAHISTVRTRKWLIIIGVVMEACGLGGIALAISCRSLPGLMLALVMTGAAFGLAWAAISQVVLMASSDDDRDRSSALLPTLQSFGYGMGAALAGFIANQTGFSGAASPEVIGRAIASSFLFGFAVMLLAIIIAIGLMRRLTAPD